jgi:4-amino-4-deoxy-L-arabinose transferase-like glycosyltransferase
MKTLATSVRRLLRRPSVVLAIAAIVLTSLSVRELVSAKPGVLGASGARADVFVTEIPRGGGKLCAAPVTLPRGATSLEFLVGTFGKEGPPLKVTLRDSKGLVATGRLQRGWGEGPVTVPLKTRVRADQDRENLRLCIRSRGGDHLAFGGELDGTGATTVNGVSVPGRISVLAKAEGKKSIAQMFPQVAQRIGRGNASWIGPWTLFAIGVLVLLAVSLGALAVLKIDDSSESKPMSSRTETAVGQRLAQGVRSIPISGRALTGAALAIGAAWAFLTPPFQVPDETSHFAYVQYLSESGRLPVEKPGAPPFSHEQREILGALGFARIIGRGNEPVLLSRSGEDHLRSTERRNLAATSGGNATTASANPPLYYLLQAPVYLATSRGSLLTQLIFMRLLSVLLMAGSVLFAYLFIREMLPSSPWAWTAGGLACAFQPVLGFIGSGVNADSLLFLCATGLFLATARILRRGLTTRHAIELGLAVALGLLTKPLFLSLVPVAGLALVLGAIRLAKGWTVPVAAAVATIMVPVMICVVVGEAAFDHPYFAVASSVASGPGHAAVVSSSLTKEISFILQLFLPRLPMLTDLIPGVPIQGVWINGFVGVFGWLDYGFGPHALTIGTRVFELLLVLLVIALVRYRRAVFSQWPLLLCCLVGLVCVLGAVGVTDYRALVTNTSRFEQARYLLPLLALYGALFGLGAKAVGPRVGRFLVPALWLLVSFHTIVAMVLTIDRYYV